MQFYSRQALEPAPQPFRQVTPTPRTGRKGAAWSESGRCRKLALLTDPWIDSAG